MDIFVLGYLLHQFIFYPNKISIHSSSSLKVTGATQAAGPSTSTTGANTSTSSDAIGAKTQDLENVMFRLSNLLSSMVSLPFKKESTVSSVCI